VTDNRAMMLRLEEQTVQVGDWLAPAER